jgi:universal stress protein A
MPIQSGNFTRKPEKIIKIEFGSVKNEVLRVAEEIGADLIVIGSHGRHGLSRLLGSSTSGIVQGAECDVLTIRVELEE